jgi:outer membrane protein assembly factor BamB
MSGATDVVTYHNDLARTGQNLTETVLTPSNVNSASFGKLGFFSVDGKVDAEPLLLAGIDLGSQGTHDVLYLATEHDSVYAMDAATGTVYWRVSLLGAGETTSDNHGCS